MILLHCLETVRPALSYSGVPTQSFILRSASPKVREHGHTTPVAYELASDTWDGLGVVTRTERPNWGLQGVTVTFGLNVRLNLSGKATTKSLGSLSAELMLNVTTPSPSHVSEANS